MSDLCTNVGKNDTRHEAKHCADSGDAACCGRRSYKLPEYLK